MESVEDDEAEWRAPCSISPIPSLGLRNISSSAPHKVIVHFDMDCFYAQVEMLRNPALRHVPLGIQQKYIVVTCNYVAREQGVTKLMSVTEAKEKCPELVLVKGEDLSHYRELSHKVTELLVSYCPLVERLGFDENFMDITEMVERRLQQNDTCTFNGHVYNINYSEDKAKIYPWLAVGSQIAAELRDSIHCHLGLTACAGIATNKLLSKLVSGTFKPNQQTTLLPEDISSLMGSLSGVRKIQGIGHQTAKRLQALGVSSIKDLELFPLDNLAREFGQSSARRLKNIAIGSDDSAVSPTGAPQSLSDEDSFKKMSSPKEVLEKIKELLACLVERLVIVLIITVFFIIFIWCILSFNRMHNDGRRPQTLRLTIRRYSATNKWYSRESRQGPIPSNIGQKIINGHFDNAVDQLTSLAMKFFHKMVVCNKAFHLTLINVCFTNMQTRTPANGKSSLISFFKQSPSPTKTQMSTSHNQVLSNSSEEPFNEDEHNPHSSFRQQIETEEERTENFQLVISGLKRTDSSISLQCIGQNTESQPEGSSHLPPNIDPEVFRCLPQEVQNELLLSNISTELQSLDPGVRSMRKPSTTDSSGPVSGNFKMDNSFSLSGSSDDQIPGNVDPIVFSELPPELQLELRSEWRQENTILKAPSLKKVSKTSTHKGKKATGKASSQSNSLLKYFKPQF